MTATIATPKFRTGQVVTSCGVNNMASHPLFTTFIMQSLRRHVCGDWGDCYPEDANLNDQSLIPGNEGRIFSIYNLPQGLVKIIGESRIWIITEWNRSATTILYPSEY